MTSQQRQDDPENFTIGACDLCDEPAKWLVNGTQYLCTQHMIEANEKSRWLDTTR